MGNTVFLQLDTFKLQIFVVNKFLHYQFFDYGLRVYMWYSMPPEERLMSNLNPMCEVFPRLAACDYVRYGPGGGQEMRHGWSSPGGQRGTPYRPGSYGPSAHRWLLGQALLDWHDAG